MTTTPGIVTAVGNTPMIRLDGVSAETGCEIFGKAEFLNPSGSVKDRAALGILRAAEADNSLGPGGTVIEGTAGNTGIGLAALCNALGYGCVIVIPETQAPEKIVWLRALGADVRTVPANPYRNPNNFQHVARRLAENSPGAVWANQFDNLANRRIHTESTGPEVWQQMEGRLHAFVAATGTGGTLAGVSDYLKAQNNPPEIVLADPTGSALYAYVKEGEPRMDGPGSISEGIGNSRITANLAGAAIDDAVQVTDPEVVFMTYRLIYEEGLYLGGSAALNVCAAVDTAKRLGPGHRIVTVLCDGGERYQSRLFSPDWLQARGLDEARQAAEQRFRRPVSADKGTPLVDVEEVP